MAQPHAPALFDHASSWRSRPTHSPGAYFCIKAFSETDQFEDLKKIDVPTLILQGDDDQIVPFRAAGQAQAKRRPSAGQAQAKRRPSAGQAQAKLIKGAELKLYKGAPHGMCTTHKDQVSADLLAFIQRTEKRRAA